jgi:hypothetical protein
MNDNLVAAISENNKKIFKLERGIDAQIGSTVYAVCMSVLSEVDECIIQFAGIEILEELSDLI